MRLLIIPALVGLAACAQPEPIVDYNAPYTGKYTAPVASVRPEARPMQRRWLACPNSAQNDDCGNGESAPVKDHQATTGGGPFPVFPEVERPEPEPTPEPTPEPEPPAPEPEQPAPEPEPETHEPPPPQECPA
jgi:hypothetical protein